MANKSNKERQLSWRKGTRGKKPWPNLPQQLLSYIIRKRVLMENISIPGTIKSFRLPSRRCQSNKNLQLLELVDVGISDWSAQRETTRRYVNIPLRFGEYLPCYRGLRPELSDPETMVSYIVGIGNGSICSRLSNPSKYIVDHMDPGYGWRVPDWDVSIPFKFVLISGLSVCHLVFTGVSDPAFVFYLGWNNVNVWLKRDCTVIDPNDPKQQFMRFGTAIACQGKLYALSMQGTVAVLEVINSDVAITSISKTRAVPSVNAKYFRECLVESDGEILLVFLIFQKSMANVDQVEVYKLEVPKLRWVKMEELGDRALFVEPECCIWVKASEVGCRSSCVFFSTVIDDWWTYDLKSGTISSGWSKKDLA